MNIFLCIDIVFVEVQIVGRGMCALCGRNLRLVVFVFLMEALLDRQHNRHLLGVVTAVSPFDI